MAGWVEVDCGGPRWGVVCFVRATLERGGEVQQIDTREAKLKDMMVSNRFFAKTNYLMFKSHKER